MRETVIVAGDIITPLGDLNQTWKELMRGISGISLQGFGNMQGEWPLGLINGLQGAYGKWDRVQSMFDRLFASLPSLPPNTQLFCATTKGAVDELLIVDAKEHGQPWQIADYLVDRLELHESETPVTTSAACASSLIATIQGAMAISSGRCDHALVVGFDLLAEFVLSGFSSLKALSSTGAKPFDRKRDGLALGDGGGWLLLSEKECKRPEDKTLATLKQWAISCDATHITAPSRTATGLTTVLEQIQSQTSLQVGGINAHGTATVYNDAMELFAFNQKCSAGTPVCSVKGALGHSLAAAGIVELMLSVQSLQTNLLPPTIGLEDPEDSTCVLSGEIPLSLQENSILTCNSGFGGINAGILLV